MLESGAALAGDGATGRRMGAWRLVARVGSGGMGAVYRAEREEGGFTQRAAVKLMAGGALTASAARHFREEREILARLEHPGIARLIDGGVTADGVPYLAMEYVEGLPIDRWCAQAALRERLEVFVQVCDSVQFAHQLLVAHCDLKPANILVTAEGQPKLLDFGVARMLDMDRDATATVPMTLDYASPEQIRGSAVTTATDVYSLGMLLFELVTGERLYRLAGQTPDEVVAAVCEGEAPIVRTGDGDLDAIVGMAVRRLPGERYASAANLAADVRRYLEGHPVEARAPGRWYVARKFVARYRMAAVAVGVLAVALAAAGLSVLREARIARARFDRVRQLAHFAIFDMNDAVAPIAGSTPVRKTLVAQGLQYLDRLASESGGDAGLQKELAGAYLRLGDVLGYSGEANLGDIDGALRSQRKAEALLEPLCGRDARDPACADLLANVYQHLSAVELDRDRPGAVRTVGKLVNLTQREYANRSDDKALAALATAYTARADVEQSTGDPAASLRDFSRAGDLFEKVLAHAPDNANRQRNAALAHKYIAGHLAAYGASDGQVVAQLRRAEELDGQRVKSAPGNRLALLDLSFDLSQDGYYARKLNRNQEARDLFERTLEIRKELSRGDPADARLRGRVNYAEFQLAKTELLLKDTAGAMMHAQAAVQGNERELRVSGTDEDREDVFEGYALLGDAEAAAGRRQAACGSWRKSEAIGSEYLKRRPEDAEARQAMAQVQSGLHGCGRN